MTVRLPNEISGGAVTLRRWTGELRAALESAVTRSAAELQAWLPSGWTELTEVDAFLAVAAEGFERGSLFAFAVCNATEVVGHISLAITDGTRAEIGYWTCSDRTGRGYCTAAVGSITEAALQGLHELRRIEILCDEANTASARVAAKNGFQHVGSREIALPTPPRSGTEMVWIREA